MSNTEISVRAASAIKFLPLSQLHYRKETNIVITVSLDLLIAAHTLAANQTEETLLHHLQAIGEGDIDAVLSDFTEDAVLITADGLLKGHGEIRSLFEKLLSNVLPPGSAFEMLQQITEGEIAYIAWSAESPSYKIPLGTDTFIIRDGKIVVQTLAAQIEAKSG